jgi:flagellar basal body rod protein FlgB
MEAPGSYEMLVHIYETTWCHIPYNIIYSHRRKNLKSHISFQNTQPSFYRLKDNRSQIYIDGNNVSNASQETGYNTAVCHWNLNNTEIQNYTYIISGIAQ